MEIEQIAEYELGQKERKEIRCLLEEAFSTYPEEGAYWQQLPSFRLLVRRGSDLLGHMGVEYRRVRVGEEHFRIFGIADLCVHPDFRSSGVGGRLIDHLQELASEYQAQFMLTFASRSDFYVKNGFEEVHTPCRWLMIHQGVTMGVMQRKLSGVMVKPLDGAPWPKGELDLLGHIF